MRLSQSSLSSSAPSSTSSSAPSSSLWSPSLASTPTLWLSAAAVAAGLAALLLTGCPEGAEGEGEGDVVAGEGEGEVGEGEGEVAEGEGEVLDCSGKDAVLGAAVIGEGFVVVDSVAAPADPSSWAALATLHRDDGAGTVTDAVFALDLGLQVEGFGAWPALSLSDAIPANLAPPDFVAGTDFVGSYLVADDDHFVAGFTSAADFSGTVVVHTRNGNGGSNVFLGGDGNFDGKLVSAHVIVSGLSLGIVDEASVFGLDDLVTPTPRAVISFGADQSSSHVAVGNGLAFFGTAAAPDFVNRYFAFDLAAVDAVFAGTPLVATAEPAFSQANVGGVFFFADGLGVVDGFLGFDARGLQQRVVTRGGDANAVVGDPVSALTLEDGCTNLGPVAEINGDLLVTLVHHDVAATIIRLHKVTP